MAETIFRLTLEKNTQKPPKKGTKAMSRIATITVVALFALATLFNGVNAQTITKAQAILGTKPNFKAPHQLKPVVEANSQLQSASAKAATAAPSIRNEIWAGVEEGKYSFYIFGEASEVPSQVVVEVNGQKVFTPTASRVDVDQVALEQVSPRISIPEYFPTTPSWSFPFTAEEPGYYTIRVLVTIAGQTYEWEYQEEVFSLYLYVNKVVRSKGRMYVQFGLMPIFGLEAGAIRKFDTLTIQDGMVEAKNLKLGYDPQAESYVTRFVPISKSVYEGIQGQEVDVAASWQGGNTLCSVYFWNFGE